MKVNIKLIVIKNKVLLNLTNSLNDSIKLEGRLQSKIGNILKEKKSESRFMFNDAPIGKRNCTGRVRCIFQSNRRDESAWRIGLNLQSTEKYRANFCFVCQLKREP